MHYHAVFQHLMNGVPTDGPEFVTVYIGDVLIFSESLKDLELVLQGIQEGIKTCVCKLST